MLTINQSVNFFKKGPLSDVRMEAIYKPFNVKTE